MVHLIMGDELEHDKVRFFEDSTLLMEITRMMVTPDVGEYVLFKEGDLYRVASIIHEVESGIVNIDIERA